MSGDLRKPLRIGVLCNEAGLTAWQVDCLNKVKQLDFADIVVFVRNCQPQIERSSTLTRLRAKLASGLLLWRAYERMIVDRKSAASKAAPIPASLSGVPRVDVKPLRVSKFRQAFDPDSLERLRKHELDVLLRFGFGILTGEILNLTRFGIWSFHHGDPDYFRGAPPGFWEIHNGDPVTGVVLQRLTETLDGGVILHSGWFKTNAANYSKSLDRILFGSTHFVARALRDLRNNPEQLMYRNPLQNSGPIYRYPRTLAMMRFFARIVVAKIRNQLNALFRHQQWSVGIIDQSAVALFENLAGRSERLERVAWHAEPAGGFLADPFPLDLAGEALIIAEEFDWKTGLGQISTVPLSTGKATRPRPAIRSGRHLSYPYTFRYAGETYCVPECAQGNSVVLYRLAAEEGRWVEQKQLVAGFPAVDPTIFRHEDRWWLFCTSAEAGANEYLYAWFATEPLGEWIPHAANPLKVDIRAARPAGRPFLSQGTLIRPAQDCSRIYGGAITFNRILMLTPEQFSEERAGQLLPDADRYSAGLHTIASCGEQTIVDGARLKFVPNEFWRSARNTIRKVRV